MIRGLHRASSPFQGKVVLIVIAVISATGGFSLGYLVGQSMTSAPATAFSKQLPSTPSSTSTIQESYADLKADTRSAETIEQNPSGGNLEAAAPVSSEPVKHISAAVKSDDKSVMVKTESDRKNDKTTSPESAVSKKKAVFTVQAGAFRRQKDADALKRSLEAKGYQVSIRKESNSKGTILFKVCVGGFERKEEASVTALKLKKTEGLNAFAIAKN